MLSNFLPHATEGVAFKQTLVSSVGQAGWFEASSSCFVLHLQLGIHKELSEFRFRLRLCKLLFIHKCLVLITVPLEHFWSVLIANRAIFKSELLEQHVKGLVAATALCDVHQLVIIPLLCKHLFWPGLWPSKELNMLIGAVQAHKNSEQYDAVRSLVDPTVQAPFIVVVVHQDLSQILLELSVYWQHARLEWLNFFDGLFLLDDIIFFNSSFIINIVNIYVTFKFLDCLKHWAICSLGDTIGVFIFLVLVVIILDHEAGPWRHIDDKFG